MMPMLNQLHDTGLMGDAPDLNDGERGADHCGAAGCSSGGARVGATAHSPGKNYSSQRVRFPLLSIINQPCLPPGLAL